jgi:hypothetical protein
MLDQTNTENIPNTSRCPRCLEVGISVQLGPRLYKKEELIDGELPYDSFDWLECRDCGHIVEDYFN